MNKGLYTEKELNNVIDYFQGRQPKTGTYTKKEVSGIIGYSLRDYHFKKRNERRVAEGDTK